MEAAQIEKLAHHIGLSPLERVGASERMHAVHLFLLSPEIVLHQAFDHEIMATRGLRGSSSVYLRDFRLSYPLADLDRQMAGWYACCRPSGIDMLSVRSTMCASACRMRTNSPDLEPLTTHDICARMCTLAGGRRPHQVG